ncbi:hypothetical protein PIROE2DRAFT_9200 [Piromyces sp. E2]|nr:hypothetical protein PIROE2DRAFT_9200 [Piromyces sp. E2]|eukprot:OUM64102.1 hypothetical protein PIROE2DRAFT_9200 [Piromyces sp. E2]
MNSVTNEKGDCTDSDYAVDYAIVDYWIYSIAELLYICCNLYECLESGTVQTRFKMETLILLVQDY